MTTFRDVVEQVSNALHAFTVQEQLTWLTAAVADTTTTALTVNNGDKISEGVIEVDDELMYVASVATNAVTVAPFGRGYRGSTAATHAINARVVFDPHFPRVEIKRAIVQTIASVYPRLYQIKDTTLVFSGAAATYELPADADSIVKVQYEVTGPSGYWAPITAWEFHRDSEVTSGRALTFHEAPEQNRTVKVTYRAPFGTLSADADTLASVGLPESAVDMVVYGAAGRLVQFLDVSRLQQSSVENANRSQYVNAGDPARLANQFYAMHVTRLEEERKKLLELDPPQMHYTR